MTHPAAVAIATLEARLRADPDDWQSWLVYADWLHEQGDGRGALINLEHRLATTPMTAEEARTLRSHIHAMIVRHSRAWSAGLAFPLRARPQWRGGFVVGVRLPWDRGMLGVFTAAASHPNGRFLTALSIHGEALRRAEVEVLARSGEITKVRALDLRDNRLGDAGAQVLAACPGLGGLRSLDLRDNGIGDEGVAALEASATLRGCTIRT